MAMILRSAIVDFTQSEMFALVNDIEKYPEFLPWCQSSRIFSRSEQIVEAELVIAWGGIHKSFITRNRLVPDSQIDITLVKGPFRHLEGKWDFIPLEKGACKVELKLEFEWTGNFFDLLFQPIFHHMANTLVDLFCQRAKAVYAR